VDNNQIVNFSVAANQTKTLQAYAYVGGNSSAIHRADYSFERECAQQPLIGAPPVYPLDNTEASLMTPTLSTTTYTLDNAGNRRSVNGQSYSPNVINQYTSAAGYPVTNGSEHEISDYYGFHYVYMRDQELIKVTVPGLTYDLAYDALGRCVRRTFNNSITTYYIYDGDKPILEYNANNALVGFNLYGKGVDEIVERGAYGTDNQWHWYFLNQDHEGSVTHLTDADGNVIERYRYDVFGAPLFYNGSGTQIWASAYGNRFLFTGREYGGAWMYEYRARMYHSGLGRFMSEDPKLFDAGDYNLFRYCHNDPIDFTDPMGTQGDHPDPWPTHLRQAIGTDLSNAERISLWQKSMETSVGGENASRLLQLDTLARQLQGSSSGLEQSPRFRAFIPFIFRWEGGYDNDPHDRGGETNFGIDARSHPGVDIRHLTKDGAEHIYWQEWGTSRSEALRYPLGEVYFNAYENVGQGAARMLLRRSAEDPLSYIKAQESYYRKIPNNERFLRGWINRSEDLKQFFGLEP
jgi:RHS repeat-associated protein